MVKYTGIVLIALLAVLSTAIGHLLLNRALEHQHALGTASQTRTEIFHVSDQVIYLDEVLTMSARMYALTSNTDWKERYDQHVPILDQQITFLNNFSSASNVSGATDTDKANQQLIAMEEEAFLLTQQGQPEAAYRLLSSDKYKQQKNIYSKGIQQFIEELKKYSNSTYTDSAQQLEQVIHTIIWLLPLLVILSWLIASILLRHSYNKLNHTFHQLQQATQAKDVFLASMSHELRTPLTSIIGNSELLLDSGFCGDNRCPNQDAHKILQSIQRAGNNQLALVNDILDMSKIESGKFAIDNTPYDFSQLIQELQQTFSERISDAGLQFVVEQQNHEPHLLTGDSRRINQILINLIGNAIKFTEQGKIELTTRVDQNRLTLQVKDSGIGMSEETIKRLFQRFKQADSSISRRFGGSGLGLYISKNLVTMMGGEIAVSSQEGVGSTFTVTLPYLPTDLAISKPHTTADSKPVSEKKLSGHVLIAEDTPELQLLERRILESLDLTVTAANNGEEAVSVVNQTPIDLVLMDMQMPVMDGIEATRTLRQQGHTLPIIALTANVMQRHRDAFHEAGCNDFLGKPIDRNRLKELLEQHLNHDSKAAGQATASIEEEVDDELMALFIESTVKRKAALAQALSDEDWQQLRQLAHEIKGSAASFGQPQLSIIAEQIQLSIDNQQFDTAPEQVTELLTKIEAILPLH